MSQTPHRGELSPSTSKSRFSKAIANGSLVLMPLGVVLLASAASRPAPPAPTAHPATQSFEKDVLPLINKYCVGCHTGDSPSAGVSLSEYKTEAQMLKARNLWEKVGSNTASKHMPPMEMPQPTDTERLAIVGYIESALSKADCAVKMPGRVTMRRLNRAEYNNTVRDLFALAPNVRPADEFPSDDVGYGFDNIGDVLTISPLLMEKYLNAARRVTRAAIIAPEDRIPYATTYEGTKLEGTGGGPEAGGYMLSTNGAAGVDFNFLYPGEYTIKVRAGQQAAGPESAKMGILLGAKELKQFEVDKGRRSPGTYTATINIENPGKQRVAVSFLNDFYDETIPDPSKRDRNLIVQQIEIVPGNVDTTKVALPPSHNKVLFVKPQAQNEKAYDAATRQILSFMARRAYRRPVTADEIGKLSTIAKITRSRGGSWERSVQASLQAMLVSPNFLFRVETDPANFTKGKRPLNDYELATRLSYFLWSSLPDEQLFTLAAQKKLHDPQVLVAQAKRMLKDPKAKALSDNFAGQWLNLRKLSIVSPDIKKYPNFNEDLRTAMRRETELYFQGIVGADRSVLEFLDSDYTYLNAPLAKLYGISGVNGNDFRRVALTGDERGGIITQASILTLTSNPNRTSPVKRGRWVLDNILGTPPPPAPPNVPELADDKKGPLVGTLRQRLEEHRKNPTCASCHQRMDPIGFGLENYDAIGEWRLLDGTDKIDPTGEMPDGYKVKGSDSLRKYLMSRKGQFTKALTERMMTYALGRGIESYDRCNINTLSEKVASNQYKFSSVIAQIVTSEPFRYRSAEEAMIDAPSPAPAAPKKSAPAKAVKRRVAAK